MPVPPADVRRTARNALERRQRFGRGGTEVGVARARDLANGRNISESTLRRMASYFARHGGQDAGSAPRDSAANIAWGLWGGSAGEAWVRSQLAKLDRSQND